MQHDIVAQPARAADYVNSTRGTVDRRIFWDPDIYQQQELKNVFFRSWLFVRTRARSAARRLPHHLYGRGRVIVSRGRDGNGVFLNSCPHRGNRVCFADRANSVCVQLPRLGVRAGRVLEENA